MKLLLAVLALMSAGPVAADCPKAADWARAFYSERYSFYADPSDRVLQFTTQEFGALLKSEWEYSNGEIGHLDYDPWLGGQDGEIGKPVRLSVETESPDTAIVSMSFRSCLTPSTRPNGTRCTWYCASENTSAGSFKISSLRAATRCHMCTHFRGPKQLLQPTVIPSDI